MVRYPAVYFAKQLTSSRVVTGFPAQRLAYLSEQIVARDAQHCAVLKPRTFGLLGLVKFSTIAANPGTATRILADLMQPPPEYRVYESDPVEQVVDLLVQHDPTELTIESESGAFVGLITPESFTRWLLATEPALEFALGRLPANSRWNPYPASFENSQSKTG